MPKLGAGLQEHPWIEGKEACSCLFGTESWFFRAKLNQYRATKKWSKATGRKDAAATISLLQLEIN